MGDEKREEGTSDDVTDDLSGQPLAVPVQTGPFGGLTRNPSKLNTLLIAILSIIVVLAFARAFSVQDVNESLLERIDELETQVVGLELREPELNNYFFNTTRYSNTTYQNYTGDLGFVNGTDMTCQVIAWVEFTPGNWQAEVWRCTIEGP